MKVCHRALWQAVVAGLLCVQGQPEVKEPRVVVALMVRDEEANLRANLGQWRSVADYVVCGVDERTKDQSARAVMEALPDVERWVFYFRFLDFGQGRTVVLREAWRKFGEKASHVLVVDPDWAPVEGTLRREELDWTHRTYSFLVYDRNGLTTRTLAWLFRHEAGLKFKYRLHEVVDYPRESAFNTDMTTTTTTTKRLSWEVREVEVRGRRTWHTDANADRPTNKGGEKREQQQELQGGHSQSYRRYLRDLEFLERDLEDLGDTDPHTTYYLGATHLSALEAMLGIGTHAATPEADRHVDAGVRWLSRRLEPDVVDQAETMYGGKNEETWAAMRWLAHALHFYKNDHATALDWYDRCGRYDPLRVDCLAFAAALHRQLGHPGHAWETLVPALQTDFTDGQRTFAHNFYVYNCSLPLEASLALLPTLKHRAFDRDQNWHVLLTLGNELINRARTNCLDPTRRFITAGPDEVDAAIADYARLVAANAPGSPSCVSSDAAFAAADHDPRLLAMMRKWGLQVCDNRSYSS